MDGCLLLGRLLNGRATLSSRIVALRRHGLYGFGPE
jgi:hypothetical protein